MSPGKSDHNIVFIKNYNSFDIETFKSRLNISEGSLSFSYTYEAGKMHAVFEPILDWLRMLVMNENEMDINELLNTCDVYSLHRELIASYMENGICKRNEDVILPEIKYERERLYSDIVQLFSYFAKKKHMVMIFNNVHCADSSTIRLLTRFLSNDACKNIFFIVVYNDFYKTPAYVTGAFNELLEYAHGNFFHVSDNSERDIFNTASFESFHPKINECDDYIQKIWNMVATLCTDQALYYLNILHNKFEIEQMEITEEQRLTVMQLQAIANLYEGNNRATLLLCDKINTLVSDKEYDILFNTQYIAALAHNANDHFDFAQTCLKKCEKIAEESGDEYMIFKGQLLRYMLEFFVWKHVCLYQNYVMISDEFIEKANKYKYYNHLAYIITFTYREGDILDIAKCMYPHFDEGIGFGRQLGNDNFILNAFHEKVYTASCIGNFDDIQDYQDRCIEILDRMNNPLGMIGMYNSIGYNCSVHEDFTSANIYYNKTIKIIMERNIPSEMYEVLYNKSILAIQTMNYEMAKEYLLMSLAFIEELKIEKLRIANKSKLYGFLAMCYYYLGEEYNCYLYMSKLERYVSHIIYDTNEEHYALWDDDLFLYFFLKAVLAKKEGSYEAAEKHFERAKIHMNRSTENKYFSMPMYSLEKADLYNCLGEQEMGKNMLKECMDFCSKKNYSFKYAVVNSVYSGLNLFKSSYDLSLGDLNKQEILNLAKQSGIALDLQNRNNDISFLSTWKDLMMTSSTPEILIDNAMTIIKSTYALDKTHLYEVKEDGVNILQSDLKHEIDEEGYNYINSTLLKLTGGFVTSRVDDEFINFKGIINLIDPNAASIMFCPIIKNEKLIYVFIGVIGMHNNYIDNNTKLYETNLEIASFAIRQLVDSLNILNTQIDLQNINKKLAVTAVTDNLTGLFNRQGMYKIIDDIVNDKGYNIIYVDLDNFKMYNDTFGHDIGDNILVEFSNLLKRVTIGKSYIIRYGGDEFLIINVSQSLKEAENMAINIFDELSNASYFRYVIDDICKEKNIDFPYTLTCSIGISRGVSKSDIDEVIIKADNEMFKVKKNNKNNYSINTESV